MGTPQDGAPPSHPGKRRAKLKVVSQEPLEGIARGQDVRVLLIHPDGREEDLTQLLHITSVMWEVKSRNVHAVIDIEGVELEATGLLRFVEEADHEGTRTTEDRRFPD
jgi:hypothetical protein